MKQKLYSIISILKKLADNQKNIDIHNIENEFMLQFKELNDLLKESRKLEYDDEFKQKINELGLVIKKIETNQNSQSKIFADFKKYLKDRNIN